MEKLFDGLLIASMVLLAISIGFIFYRIVKGPSVSDRVVSLDSIGIHLISMTAILCVYFRTTAYTEIVLLIGILSFIGTTAFSKFIEGGVVIERRRDR